MRLRPRISAWILSVCVLEELRRLLADRADADCGALAGLWAVRAGAAGDTLRRLAGKVAVAGTSWNFAVAVRAPNGCAAVVHGTRQWMHRNRNEHDKFAI